MSELTKIIKENFENQLNQDLSQLETANEQMNDYKSIVNQWPQKKQKINAEILYPMRKWIKKLKQISTPFKLIQFKREKRKLLRFKYIPLSNWTGIKLGSKVAFLWFLNILRIILILSFYIAILLLIGFAFVKIINFLGNLL